MAFYPQKNKKHSMNMNFAKLIIILFFVASVATNAYFLYQKKEAPKEIKKSYDFLAKRIFLENSNDTLINFTLLRSQLNEYTSSRSNPTGVYFEYLPTGVSIGVNQNGRFITASLLKIPIAMAVYRQLEEGKIKEDQLLTIKESHLDQFFGEGYTRKIGSQIKVSEALHDMIVFSDNTAKNVLLDQIPFGSLLDISESLDIPVDKNSFFDTITPKNYSSILRSLFFSAYLNYENSDTLLRLLSETPFKDKLSAGIPENIKFSHKIGVFEIEGEKNKSIFSDCGIVYIPNRPYIICVMSASPEKEAQESMKEISNMVYKYVSEKP